MPQGRRKIPFSGKAKKVQIQMKRDKKEDRSKFDGDSKRDEASSSDVPTFKPGDHRVLDKGSILMDVQLRGRGSGQAQRYELLFKQESKAELARNRELARQPLKRQTDPKYMEVALETFYPSSTDFPKRPPWDPNMSKPALEANEARYFKNYVNELMELHEKSEGQNLSYFELNLETWRQLWRVIEMSDILLVIVDVRFPAFPPSLYDFVNSDTTQKHIILIINKVDLIPAGLALAWKDYFENKFENLSVVFFSSCPSYNLSAGLTATKTGLKFRRLRGRISMVAEGARSIFEECKRIAQKSPELRDIDLDSWWQKIVGASTGKEFDHPTTDEASAATSDDQKVITIGTIGHPNVGKSSLINSLMGKKVVSVSKTPGHTKHFQTIFLSRSVKLCDCPGLVFPSLMPKQLQILQGSYPIAQVREPLSIVQFLAERVDVPHMLSLAHPENTQSKWSAFDVCEAWAIKRGYNTARTNRPDVYRAANHILRMTLEGKITLAFMPPGYDKDFWENHPDLVRINELLGLSDGAHEDGNDGDNFEDSDEDEGGEVEAEEESGEEDSFEQVVAVPNKFNLLMEENSE